MHTYFTAECKQSMILAYEGRTCYITMWKYIISALVVPLCVYCNEAPTAGNSYVIKTTGGSQNNYKTFWMKPVTDHLVFWLRGCDDGHVLITEQYMQTGENVAVEFDIGAYANTQMYIRRGAWTANYLCTSTHPGPFMDCYEWRRFWISWRNGNVQIGTGSLPVLSCYTNINPKYISFTDGSGAEDSWAIDEPENQVKEFTIITPGDPTKYKYDNSYIMTRGYNYVVFSVKACSRAGIMLEPVQGASSVGDFEIIIGMSGNKGIQITDNQEGSSKQECTGCSLLDCGTAKTFWIIWDRLDKRFVRVGKGDKPGSSQLVNFAPNRDNWKVAGVAFQTLEQFTGEYMMITSGHLKDIPGDGLSGGAIFGIIVGSVVLAILVGAAIIFLVPGARDKAGAVFSTFSKKPAEMPTHVMRTPASTGGAADMGQGSMVTDNKNYSY